MRKADVQFHYASDGPPAVNVKVHAWPFFAKVDRDDDWPEGFWTWLDKQDDPDPEGHFFGFACELGFEQLQTDAEEIFGRGVKVYAEGRSGGWAVVEGLPPVDEWDAVMLGKWARFCKWARQQADGIPWAVADLLAYNVYLPEQERLEARRLYAFGHWAEMVAA